MSLSIQERLKDLRVERGLSQGNVKNNAQNSLQALAE